MRGVLEIGLIAVLFLLATGAILNSAAGKNLFIQDVFEKEADLVMAVDIQKDKVYLESAVYDSAFALDLCDKKKGYDFKDEVKTIIADVDAAILAGHGTGETLFSGDQYTDDEVSPPIDLAPNYREDSSDIEVDAPGKCSPEYRTVYLGGGNMNLIAEDGKTTLDANLKVMIECPVPYDALDCNIDIPATCGMAGQDDPAWPCELDNLPLIYGLDPTKKYIFKIDKTQQDTDEPKSVDNTRALRYSVEMEDQNGGRHYLEGLDSYMVLDGISSMTMGYDDYLYWEPPEGHHDEGECKVEASEDEIVEHDNGGDVTLTIKACPLDDDCDENDFYRTIHGRRVDQGARTDPEADGVNLFLLPTRPKAAYQVSIAGSGIDFSTDLKEGEDCDDSPDDDNKQYRAQVKFNDPNADDTTCNLIGYKDDMYLYNHLDVNQMVKVRYHDNKITDNYGTITVRVHKFTDEDDPFGDEKDWAKSYVYVDARNYFDGRFIDKSFYPDDHLSESTPFYYVYFDSNHKYYNKITSDSDRWNEKNAVKVSPSYTNEEYKLTTNYPLTLSKGSNLRGDSWVDDSGVDGDGDLDNLGCAAFRVLPAPGNIIYVSAKDHTWRAPLVVPTPNDEDYFFTIVGGDAREDGVGKLWVDINTYASITLEGKYAYARRIGHATDTKYYYIKGGGRGDAGVVKVKVEEATDADKEVIYIHSREGVESEYKDYDAIKTLVDTGSSAYTQIIDIKKGKTYEVTMGGAGMDIGCSSGTCPDDYTAQLLFENLAGRLVACTLTGKGSKMKIHAYGDKLYGYRYDSSDGNNVDSVSLDVRELANVDKSYIYVDSRKDYKNVAGFKIIVDPLNHGMSGESDYDINLYKFETTKKNFKYYYDIDNSGNRYKTKDKTAISAGGSTKYLDSEVKRNIVSRYDLLPFSAYVVETPDSNTDNFGCTALHLTPGATIPNEEQVVDAIKHTAANPITLNFGSTGRYKFKITEGTAKIKKDDDDNPIWTRLSVMVIGYEADNTAHGPYDLEGLGAYFVLDDINKADLYFDDTIGKYDDNTGDVTVKVTSIASGTKYLYVHGNEAKSKKRNGETSEDSELRNFVNTHAYSDLMKYVLKGDTTYKIILEGSKVNIDCDNCNDPTKDGGPIQKRAQVAFYNEAGKLTVCNLRDDDMMYLHNYAGTGANAIWAYFYDTSDNEDNYGSVSLRVVESANKKKKYVFVDARKYYGKSGDPESELEVTASKHGMPDNIYHVRIPTPTETRYNLKYYTELGTNWDVSENSAVHPGGEESYCEMGQDRGESDSCPSLDFSTFSTYVRQKSNKNLLGCTVLILEDK